MILYRSNTADFIDEVDRNVIVNQIDTAYLRGMGRRAADSERRAWNNSMRFMETIVRKSNIPDDCGILIEYNIPSTSKRIDFVITGHDDWDHANFMIIELKQWESAEATDKESIVKTFLNNGIRETTHPAYQAFSYKKYLSDMNSAVYEGSVRAVSCAYLHNYQKKNPEPLLESQYEEIVNDTPIFFSSDAEKLEDFVSRYVGKGNGLGILYEIENGKIAPSKKFVEYVADVFEGNPVYTLLDEQKVAYSSIVDIALKTKTKTAVIVNGGPGTGKSVVAMNAFVSLLEKRLNVRFVAPNASFRESMVDTLGRKSSATKKRLKSLFSGSGSFVHAYTDEFDALICDEAHRLKKKGAFMYAGESQVEDIVKAARVSVFFIDDDQAVRPDDEGSVARIREACEKFGASVEEVRLEAQFRCSGADGYINWVNHTLQIRDTGNFDGWDEGTYEFKVFDDPNEMYMEICKKNEEGFKARMLAGFAWEWTSDGNDDAQVKDVTIPECNFSMPWNSRRDQYSWATDENKSNQVGCIHTSQGLEFDYVGVIIGNDLQFDPTSQSLFASFDEYKDSAGKKGLKNKNDRLTAYIKRIYKVLMSRGMKGCYVYCRDQKLAEYLKGRMK